MKRFLSNFRRDSLYMEIFFTVDNRKPNMITQQSMDTVLHFYCGTENV